MAKRGSHHTGLRRADLFISSSRILRKAPECGLNLSEIHSQPENLRNMKTAKQLLETYLAAISAGEMERAIALFADDGGIEFPYFGSVNLPTCYQGPEALRRFFAPVMDGAENFKFKNIKIFPGEDQNHVSGEYEVDAVIKKTGRRYRQLYGGRLIAENGKIKLLREFCDTVEVARAMFPNGVKDLVQKD
jgi:ketosteroid isomerase-like protein